MEATSLLIKNLRRLALVRLWSCMVSLLRCSSAGTVVSYDHIWLIEAFQLRTLVRDFNIFVCARSWVSFLYSAVHWWGNHGITNCVCEALFILLDEWNATRSSWGCYASPSDLSWMGHCLLPSSSLSLQPRNGDGCTRNTQRWHKIRSQKEQKLKLYRFLIFPLLFISFLLLFLFFFFFF